MKTDEGVQKVIDWIKSDVCWKDWHNEESNQDIQKLILKNFSRGTAAEKVIQKDQNSCCVYLDVDNVPCYYLIQLGGGVY